MSQITNLEVTSFKKVRTVIINPTKQVVNLAGKNTAGKSSLIDAIMSLIGGKRAVPDEPIREGSKKGSAKIKLGDGTVIERRFNKKDSVLEVSVDGEPIKEPQKWIEDRLGKESINAFSFLQMSQKKQRQAICEMVGLDIDQEEKDLAEAEKELDAMKRVVRTREADLKGMPKHEDAPVTTIDASSLIKEIQDANTHNDGIQKNQSDFNKIQDEIVRIEKELKDLREKRDTLAAEVMGAQPIEVAPLQKKLNNINEINQKVNNNIAHKKAVNEINAEQIRVTSLNESIVRKAGDIRKKISEARFPVEGLSIGPDSVTYNGKPLDQASGAEELKVCIMIACAMMKPNGLRTICITEGNRFDAESRKELTKLADELDIQLIVERVQDEPGQAVENQEEIFIRDGAITNTTVGE